MSSNFNLLRKVVLRCGSVLYGHIASITSNEPHYIIILNDNPSYGDSFALVVASSRVERVAQLRSMYGADTIAEISLGSEKFLSKPTYINCNDVKYFNVKYIKEKFDCNELKCLDATLSKDTLRQVIRCVKNSRTVSMQIKSLLPNID